MLNLAIQVVALALRVSQPVSEPGVESAAAAVRRVEMPWAGLVADVPADLVPWGAPPWLTFASRETRLELRLVEVPTGAAERPLADQLAALAAAEAAVAPPPTASARPARRQPEPFVCASGLAGQRVTVGADPASTVRASYYLLTDDRRLFAYEVIFGQPVGSATLDRYDALVRAGLAPLPASSAGEPASPAPTDEAQKAAGSSTPHRRPGGLT